MAELLAPAGSLEALKAAIYSGANAVYLGLSKFNARQKAENFNENNIKSVVDLCHLYGVKVYVTFNTLINDSEFEDLEDEVKACYDANVDAFIVTDIGALTIFRKYNIPLHASTQMGIHNYEGAKFAKDLGFSRVILSRETLEKDIIKIKTLGIEIEYFVHGALCVGFSGECLMSSFMSGDSGNRGLCKQPCRLKYRSSITNKDSYYLSTSDQCMIDKLQKLASIGVDSFKIEGRLKASHYVGEVVKQYRAALDSKFCQNYISQLKKAYNRGNFTQGYNYDKTSEIMSPIIQGNHGEYIGVITKIMGKSIVIKTDRKICLKDGVKIIKDNLELGGFQIDNYKENSGYYTINTIKTYPVGSQVYLTLDSKMVNDYSNLVLSKPIDITFTANEGEKFKITVVSKDTTVSLDFDDVETATKTPVSKESISAKLSELGETPFIAHSIMGNVSEHAFYPMSKIKTAKRDIIQKLYNEILKNFECHQTRIVHNNINQLFNKSYNLKSILCEVDDLNNLNNSIITNSEVIFNISQILGNDKQYIIKNALIHNNIEKLFLKTPKICRYDDMCILRKFIENNISEIKGLVVENIYGYELCREYNLIPITGFGINMFNSKLENVLGINNNCYSLELSKIDIDKMNNGYLYFYGDLELMILTHCPIQLNTGCTCANCKYDKAFTYTNNFVNYRISRSKMHYCYFSLFHQKRIDLRSVSLSNTEKKYINLSNCNRTDSNSIFSSILNGVSTDNQDGFLGHYYLKVK